MDQEKLQERVYRHPVMVRIFHWVNALSVVLLLMSGLQIFNSHPALYWGHDGYEGLPTVFEISGIPSLTEEKSWMKIGEARFDTSGILGVAHDVPFAGISNVAFPAWMTLPQGHDLANGRGWHLLMIWVLAVNLAVYVAYGLMSGRFRRELVPTSTQLAPSAVLRDLCMHIRLRRSVGAEACRYNLLQKMAYVVVLFILLPTMVLSGMTMSASAVAAFPWLIDLFDGRQTARTIHFIVAGILVLFTLIHLFQVFVVGFVNSTRSMITGYLKVSRSGEQG